MQAEIQRFLPAALAGFKKDLDLTDAELDRVWATTAAFTDDLFEQELVGLAAPAG